jgi:high-affinity iron transporter
MLGALVIVFREMIEAGLIVGIVLAATKGVPQRGRWIVYGIVAGVAGASLVAAFAGTIGSLFEGSGQELLNAAVLSLAVLMLTWHNGWMASHGREMARELAQVGKAVSEGSRPLAALAIVVGVAVLREGSEVVLFLYGIAASGNVTATGMIGGGALGVVAGAFVSALMYLGLLTIPTRRLFAVTSALITLLAAGLASQAVSFVQQAGYLEKWSEPLWNTEWLLSEGSILGRLLKTLIGYTSSPTGAQLVAYIATIAVIVTLMRLIGRRSALRNIRARIAQSHPAE